MKFTLRTAIFRKVLILSLLLPIVSCGTNTEDPVFPLYTFSVVGPPGIISITPVERLEYSADSFSYVSEFDLSYYVTNSENGFLGYNLYITRTDTSGDAVSLGIGGNPYMPDGIEPSFSHAGESPNTENLITRRVTHQIAPPHEKAFFFCEKYYFQMTALLRNGVESKPGPGVAACAAVDAAACPVGSGCNP